MSLLALSLSSLTEEHNYFKISIPHITIFKICIDTVVTEASLFQMAPGCCLGNDPPRPHNSLSDSNDIERKELKNVPRQHF